MIWSLLYDLARDAEYNVSVAFMLGAPARSHQPVAMPKAMRKGVHSCKECRKRKIRCTFLPEYGNVCTGCHSRGLDCTEQTEAPGSPASDHGSSAKQASIRDRLTDLEYEVRMLKANQQMMHQIQQQSSQQTPPAYPTPNPPSIAKSSTAGQSPAGHFRNAPILSCFGNDSLTSAPGEDTPTPFDERYHDVWTLAVDLRQLILGHAQESSTARTLLDNGQTWWKIWASIFPVNNELSKHNSYRAYVIDSLSQNDVLSVSIGMLSFASCVQQAPDGTLPNIGSSQITPRDMITRCLDAVERQVLNDDALVTNLRGMELAMMHARVCIDQGQPKNPGCHITGP